MTTSGIAAIGLVISGLGFVPAPARAAGFESQSEMTRVDEGKSPALAAALSAGAALLGYGTAIGLAVGNDAEPEALVLAGVALGVFGPAAGHIYLGRNPGHPVLFALGRLGFIALAFVGVADEIAHDDGQTGPANLAVDRALLGIGLLGVAGLTVWEVADSYTCAKATRRSTTTSSSLSVAPTRWLGASRSGGLMLSGRF